MDSNDMELYQRMFENDPQAFREALEEVERNRPAYRNDQDQHLTQQAEEYKSQGNSYFSKKQYSEAIDRYDSALGAMRQINEVTDMLVDTSQILHILGDYESSLSYAASAAMISKNRNNPSAVKSAQNAIQAGKLVPTLRQLDANPLENQNVLRYIATSISFNEAAGGKHDVTGSIEDAMNMKQNANDLYQEKDYDKALASYLLALAFYDSSQGYLLSTILSNRSITLQNMGNHIYAAVDASISIIIRPKAVKAHYRRIQSLQSLKLEQQSLVSCKLALRFFPENKDIISLQTQVYKALKIQEPGNERQSAYAIMPVEELQANLLLAYRNRWNIIDERVGSFHTQFTQIGFWPMNWDIDACGRYLWSCYEHSRSKINECAIEAGQTNIFNEQDLLDRIDPPTLDVQNWYEQKILKSVHFRNVRYDQSTVHSFGNWPPQNITLSQNSTHVAIGFTDLAELSVAEFEEKIERWRDRPFGWPNLGDCNLQNSGSRARSIRWIGYEQSIYSVAKTLAILEMMKGNCDVDEILQVWYSSTWSSQTLSSFRDAIQRISMEALPIEVQTLLKYWNEQVVPLPISRAAWLEDHQVPNTAVANFLENRHQMSFCKYLISGQLLPADVGSVTMYVIPENLGTLCKSESIFDVLNLNTLLERTDEQNDIMSTAIDTLRSQIYSLQQHILDKDITVEIRLGKLEPETLLIQEIRDLRPSSISWGDLCDYFSPKEFGKMVSTLQSDYAIQHYMYSLNWTKTIFGSSMIDYEAPDTRKEILQFARTRMQVYYDAIGYSKYLHCPPIGNVLYFVDWSLQTDLYQTWLEEFELASGIPLASAGTHFKRPFYITNRNNSAIDLVFNF